MTEVDRMLSVEKLTKFYGETKALDEVSFTVPDHKIIGLLGPNGAGKTTIIRILTGILPKNSGEIFFDGNLLDTNSASWKASFGIVPEVSNAYLDYSPLKNLLISGGLYGIPKKTRKSTALRLLEEFGLSKRMNVRTKKISKGEKQKLNLCMALIHNPDFLFLDEPTTGLDIQSAQLLRKKINDFRKRGKTTLLTTHNLIEANILCDEIIILNEGRIITTGSPDQLRKKFAPASKIEIELNTPLKNLKILDQLYCEYEIDDSNKKVILLSMNPLEDFPIVLKLFRENKQEISNFKVLPASLEEIFLKIIGEDENERD